MKKIEKLPLGKINYLVFKGKINQIIDYLNAHNASLSPDMPELAKKSFLCLHKFESIGELEPYCKKCGSTLRKSDGQVIPPVAYVISPEWSIELKCCNLCDDNTKCRNKFCGCHHPIQPKDVKHSHCWEEDPNWKGPCNICGLKNPKECRHEWVRHLKDGVYVDICQVCNIPKHLSPSTPQGKVIHTCMNPVPCCDACPACKCHECLACELEKRGGHAHTDLHTCKRADDLRKLSTPQECKHGVKIATSIDGQGPVCGKCIKEFSTPQDTDWERFEKEFYNIYYGSEHQGFVKLCKKVYEMLASRQAYILESIKHELLRLRIGCLDNETAGINVAIEALNSVPFLKQDETMVTHATMGSQIKAALNDQKNRFAKMIIELRHERCVACKKEEISCMHSYSCEALTELLSKLDSLNK